MEFEVYMFCDVQGRGFSPEKPEIKKVKKLSIYERKDTIGVTDLFKDFIQPNQVKKIKLTIQEIE